MVRILAFFCGVFLAVSAQAAGGISHIYFARQAAERVQDTALRDLLKKYDNAYAVGSNYPDTGYIKGTQYGEDSHWDPFIFTFADYLRDTYAHPEQENPKLVAFLLGCATHRVSDELFHWRLINQIARYDFNGDWNAAHSYADTGLDLILTVDKSQWFTHPGKWYVPVRDLVNVYQRMGHPEYTRKQIILGNSIYYFAGVGERFIAPFRYNTCKAQAPWAVANYYDHPEGGYVMTEQAVAAYIDSLWHYITHKDAPMPVIPIYSAHNVPHVVHHDVVHGADVAMRASALGFADVPIIVEDRDGSIELQTPIFFNRAAYGALLDAYLDQE